ncbi:type II toxin-antitoxin system RelE/ParE family toxin [Allofrancisella guangzhouensis]|uniref:type II toxin-antitoxin system RelE/ParE family toxin n=1 Tax=Allofrancisella guangzhouensis TaxID=594679 RepID=UPI001905C595|nr:type II toxin-antitoxin system RelE/ParE family toxin [Allofrancisella guangzhouensis]MBK2027413.1 type II toxin-antitoxin system RelE/ParE family toxin [Allofrancisella guangzhouensis]MBK2044226.1 type II toxin-antitoxin system RelE/ParE family toxin [Allofrancisella guangzhouensis]MBK2045696.1 type II toxin-antitoxin system RelE/ParE family toxin [Allofrancisella guangzhouensis]
MKVYLLPDFAKWAKKEKVTYKDLSKTADEVVNGLHDGDLGAGCYKKRIAIKGKGKRSGARTIVSYKIDNFVIYIYAYAKNDKSNLTPSEQTALKMYSKEVLMKLTAKDIEKLLSNDELIEVVL